MGIKKGDTVLVLAGNDRGKTGEVLRSLPRESRLLVRGVNLRWKHKKPNQQNPKGERTQRESPIHASNVRLAESKKPAAKGAKAPGKAKAKSS